MRVGATLVKDDKRWKSVSPTCIFRGQETHFSDCLLPPVYTVWPLAWTLASCRDGWVRNGQAIPLGHGPCRCGRSMEVPIWSFTPVGVWPPMVGGGQAGGGGRLRFIMLKRESVTAQGLSIVISNKILFDFCCILHSDK